MITNSIVQKSQLESALRLDAEYYQPEYLSFNEKLRKLSISKKFKITELGTLLTKKPRYGTSEKLIYLKHGVPFLRISDLSGEFFESDEVVCISREDAKGVSRATVKKNDILVSRTGTLGIAVYINENFDDAIYGSYFIKVSPEPNYSKYLTIYLNSELGHIQTRRIESGAIQTNLTIPAIQSYKVVLPPQNLKEEITKRFDEVLRLRKLSRSLYSQAENLLLEELGLKDFTPKEELAYKSSFLDARSAQRLDPEYFQPKYSALISKIKSRKPRLLELLSVNRLFSVRRGDFISTDHYVDKSDRGYIRIKELPTKGEIDLSKVAYIEKSFSKNNIDTLLKGDFVFAGIGATLGKTARIPKELEGSFYSNNTVRFRIKNEWKEKINSRYLQILLQSKICQQQFDQRKAQTAQAKIATKELKGILIPILPKSTQQKIADLVRKSHSARKEAKQLLGEAKRKVEKMVEKETKVGNIKNNGQ